MVRLYNSNMDNKIDNVPELTLSYIKQFVRDPEEDIV